MISDGGWVFHGKETQPLRVAGREPLLVGHDYLAVRTYSTISTDDAEWFSLTYLPLNGGKIESSAALLEASATLRELQGLSARGFAERLEATSPDPAAVPYMDLDAFNRYQKSVP